MLILALFPALSYASADSFIRAEVADYLACYWMPAVLGFLLCMRNKLIDLSIWMNIALGGAVSAWVLNATSPDALCPTAANPITSPNSLTQVMLAMTAAICAGGLVGFFNAVATRKTRFPSWLVTLFSTFVIWAGLWYFIPANKIPVSEFAFDNLVSVFNYKTGNQETYTSLAGVRIIFALLAFLTVVFILMMRSVSRALTEDYLTKRRNQLIAFVLSGMLGAFSGLLWVMDASSSPLPNIFFDDLNIPAVAILAGGFFLRGNGRTLMSIFLALPAILIITLWNQMIFLPVVFNVNLAVALLILLAISCQLSVTNAIHAQPGKQIFAMLSAALCTLALLLPPLLHFWEITGHTETTCITLGVLTAGIAAGLFSLTPISKHKFKKILQRL